MPVTPGLLVRFEEAWALRAKEGRWTGGRNADAKGSGEAGRRFCSKAVVAARRMSLESTISLASGLVATKLGTRMLDTFVMKSSKDIVLSSPVIGRPRLRRQTPSLVNLRFKFVKPLGVLHCLGHWKGNSFGICFGLVGIGLSLKNSSFSDSALLLLLQTESQWIEVTTK